MLKLPFITFPHWPLDAQSSQRDRKKSALLLLSTLQAFKLYKFQPAGMDTKIDGREGRERGRGCRREGSKQRRELKKQRRIRFSAEETLRPCHLLSGLTRQMQFICRIEYFIKRQSGHCWWQSAVNRQERSGGRMQECGGGRDGLGHGLSVTRQGSVPSQTNTLCKTESLRL